MKSSTHSDSGRYQPDLYHRPLRPFEKAYMFWYIEMLKPPHQRNQKILEEKYAFARK